MAPPDEWTQGHPGSSALLLIDVQEDFLDGGGMPVTGTTDVLPRLAELAAALRCARRRTTSSPRSGHRAPSAILVRSG